MKAEPVIKIENTRFKTIIKDLTNKKPINDQSPEKFDYKIDRDYIVNKMIKTYYWLNPMPIKPEFTKTLNDVTIFLKKLDKYRFNNIYEDNRPFEIKLNFETKFMDITDLYWIRFLAFTPEELAIITDSENSYILK
jgi:hypothetical protein